MIEKAVDDQLYNLIKKVMQVPELKDFNLGGGTNLAIKYNHRLSIDVDLFASKVVGKDQLQLIVNYFEKEFGKKEVEIAKRNFKSEHLSWLQILVIPLKTKFDIIQNIKLAHPVKIKDGIRLIDDLDIGALKLLSASDRGVQKDFYDLYLLSKLKPLEVYYDTLQKRLTLYDKKDDKTIFDIAVFKPKENLKTNLTALADFNNAGDKKKQAIVLYLLKTLL